VGEYTRFRRIHIHPEARVCRRDTPEGYWTESAEGDPDSLRVPQVSQGQEEVDGASFKLPIAEIHTSSMERLSKIEAAEDPTDAAHDE